MGTTKRATKSRSSSASKKKTPKKVVKKTAAKKVTKKSAKTTKKATKKKSPGTSTAKKPTKKALKPKPKNTLPKPTKTPLLGYSRSVALTVLAATRFPVDMESLAVGMARYGGMSLLILGAALTYYHASVLNMLPHNMVANTLSTDYGYEDPNYKDPNLIDDTSLLNDTSGSGTGDSGSADTNTYEPTPLAEFIFEAREPFSGIVPIVIEVPYAERIDLIAVQKNAGQYHDLGSAKQIDDITWEIHWDTTRFDNGDYMIKAMIQNEFGSYDETNQSYINVYNPPDEPDPATDQTSTENTDVANTDTTNQDTVDVGTPPTADSATTTDDLSADSTDQVSDTDLNTVEPYIYLSSTGGKEVDGTISLEAKTTFDVPYVVFKIVHERGDMYTIGRGQKKDAFRHVITLDTTKYDDGQYYLFVQSEYESKLVFSDREPVSITNVYVDETADAEINVDVEVDGDLAVTDTTIDATQGEQFGVKIDLDSGETINELTKLRTYVSETVAGVELYVRKIDALSSQYLGTAREVDSGVWQFIWDTTRFPNGSYAIFAKTHYQGAMRVSDQVFVKVYNEIDPIIILDNEVTEGVVDSQDTNESELHEDQIITQAINDENKLTVGDDNLEDTDSKLEDQYFNERITESRVVEVEDVPEYLEVSEETQALVQDALDKLLVKFENEIEVVFSGLAAALRSQDEIAITEAKRQIKLLKEKIIDSTLDNEEAKELAELIDNRLQRRLSELALRSEQTEEIVRDRVGEEISKDTDGDGITDYDERNIYKTSPDNPDTDGDGYVDGVEILNGFDALNPASEAVVTYESAKTSGVVREDVFEVTAITTITPDPVEDTTTVEPKNPAAVISGRGLPNSFVTLYIYSNPTVITVKTDKDGNWSYTFDKEIDDGEHEVYVGVTDNAGRVVAKSQPVRFVKTAQAFTPVDAAAASVTTEPEQNQGLMATHYMLLVGSISILAIGAILLFLGLHLKRREETPALVQQLQASELQPS